MPERGLRQWNSRVSDLAIGDCSDRQNSRYPWSVRGNLSQQEITVKVPKTTLIVPFPVKREREEEKPLKSIFSLLKYFCRDFNQRDVREETGLHSSVSLVCKNINRGKIGILFVDSIEFILCFPQ